LSAGVAGVGAGEAGVAVVPSVVGVGVLGVTEGSGVGVGAGRGSGVIALSSSGEGVAPGGRKVGLRFMAASSSTEASVARRAFSAGSTYKHR
jgi:hypothetical protein